MIIKRAVGGPAKMAENTSTNGDNVEREGATWEASGLMGSNEEKLRPVYEGCETALWRKRLVVTPDMLLDRLQVCADLATEAQRACLPSPELHNQLSSEIERVIHLLERGGLWMDAPLEQKTACDGKVYQVLLQPFVDK